MSRFSQWIGSLVNSLSAAEWALRIIGFFVVLAGGTTTALVAKGTQLFGRAGLLAWMFIGIGTALVLAIILYLVAAASKRNAEAEYVRSMARDPGVTNPLLESFNDQIIRLEDLRLPGKQLHNNKQFKRCSFVGPGAIAILGGTIQNNNFAACGDIVVLPDGANLAGIVALENCTIQSCEFYRVTIFTSVPAGREFKKHGAQVAGLPAT